MNTQSPKFKAGDLVMKLGKPGFVHSERDSIYTVTTFVKGEGFSGTGPYSVRENELILATPAELKEFEENFGKLVRSYTKK